MGGVALSHGDCEAIFRSPSFMPPPAALVSKRESATPPTPTPCAGGASRYHVASVARWPKFRPKSSKGAEKEKIWPEELVAEFWPNFTKRGRTKFWLKIPHFTLIRNTQRQRQNLIFISIGPWVERCIDVKIKLANFFPN